MFGWFKKREPEILRTGANVASPLESAKKVLTANEVVQFGIFGTIACSGFFPPREFLNEFLAIGSDPCDQDGRMFEWQPFAVSPEEYHALLAWWEADHPGDAEDRLDADCWDNWVQAVFNRLWPGL